MTLPDDVQQASAPVETSPYLSVDIPFLVLAVVGRCGRVVLKSGKCMPPRMQINRMRRKKGKPSKSTTRQGAARRPKPYGLEFFAPGSPSAGNAQCIRHAASSDGSSWDGEARKISTRPTDLRADPHSSFRVLVKEICGRLGERHSDTLSNNKHPARQAQAQGQLWRK